MREVLYNKIKSANDIKKEIVNVSQWEVDIEVRTMSGLDRANLLNKCIDAKGNVIQEKFQTGLLIACLFDPESGERIFVDADADWLIQKSSGAIEKLASVAMRVSGLTREALADAEKN